MVWTSPPPLKALLSPAAVVGCARRSFSSWEFKFIIVWVGSRERTPFKNASTTVKRLHAFGTALNHLQTSHQSETRSVQLQAQATRRVRAN